MTRHRDNGVRRRNDRPRQPVQRAPPPPPRRPTVEERREIQRQNAPKPSEEDLARYHQERIKRAERLERKDLTSQMRETKTFMGGFTQPKHLKYLDTLDPNHTRNLKDSRAIRTGENRVRPAAEAYEPHTVYIALTRYPVRWGHGRATRREVFSGFCKESELEERFRHLNYGRWRPEETKLVKVAHGRPKEAQIVPAHWACLEESKEYIDLAVLPGSPEERSYLNRPVAQQERGLRKEMGRLMKKALENGTATPVDPNATSTEMEIDRLLKAVAAKSAPSSPSAPSASPALTTPSSSSEPVSATSTSSTPSPSSPAPSSTSDPIPAVMPKKYPPVIFHDPTDAARWAELSAQYHASRQSLLPAVNSYTRPPPPYTASPRPIVPFLTVTLPTRPLAATLARLCNAHPRGLPFLASVPDADRRDGPALFRRLLRMRTNRLQEVTAQLVRKLEGHSGGLMGLRMKAEDKGRGIEGEGLGEKISAPPRGWAEYSWLAEGEEAWEGIRREEYVEKWEEAEEEMGVKRGPPRREDAEWAEKHPLVEAAEEPKAEEKPVELLEPVQAVETVEPSPEAELVKAMEAVEEELKEQETEKEEKPVAV
ncbi:hypothetical protein JCM8097_009443 [Rhodosporidiobolus ruineniae]